ncbi:MAG: sulfurtransferase [Chloroflexi bacterium]|nr:sulfurtransferase [Chloroflexota bacterium]MYF80110.1 sulfurtransferase [Chloroflexota bacterium]MYK62319.1 sulfurtransferase [Chloroflexota bacterium]
MNPLPIRDRGYANPDLLAETDWLADRLSDSNLLVIDARFPKGYAAGHIPGAVNLNGFGAIPRADNGDMAEPDEFGTLVGSLGVSEDMTVVVYDDPSQMAGMVAWAFMYYGHSDVRILDGGLAKWTTEGRPISTEVPEYPSTQYIAKPVESVYCSLEHAKSAANKPNTVFWDTRTVGEFEGTEKGWDPPPRLGRIPGAVHLHWEDMIDPDIKTLMPANELSALLMSRGITPESEINTY